MDIRSLLDKLTSDEARAALRTAAHFVLDFVGDDRLPEESNGSSSTKASDAVKIASAVAATAGVAERAVKAARKSKGGKLGLGIALGAAVGAGIIYLASPKGRAKARELYHRARGWRKPRSNGAPVEVPPPH